MSRIHHDHVARKRFGQHFLVDTHVISAIINSIAPQSNQYFVEIGPGLGALTGPLLNCISALHAVELDRDLVTYLKKRFGDRLILHAHDALDFDFAALARTSCANAMLRLVGNLPYNISSPLLFHLMSCAPFAIDQHFMLQNEVVDRMIASPGSKTYGRLSVMLQYRYSIHKLIEVAPESFSPPPKVKSAVVRMIPYAKEALPVVNEALFSEIVRAAFSQRRKTLRNALSDYRARIDFKALGFNLARRAEEVSVNEYVMLAQQLAKA